MLYILVLENNLKVVKFLLEFSNADVNFPNSEGNSALHVTSWQGHPEMFFCAESGKVSSLVSRLVAVMRLVKTYKWLGLLS